jgi:hypothetical protein
MLICDYELLEYVGIIVSMLDSHYFVLKFLMLLCNTTLVLMLEDRIWIEVWNTYNLENWIVTCLVTSLF